MSAQPAMATRKTSTHAQPASRSASRPSSEGRGVAHVDADHHHVAVGEVDELQHAVDHRVAERDQRVDGAGGQAVDEVLEEVARHSRA